MLRTLCLLGSTSKILNRKEPKYDYKSFSLVKQITKAIMFSPIGFTVKYVFRSY